MLPPSAIVGTGLPPTRFSLHARKLFLGLLVLQEFVAVGRFVVMDYWGALLATLVVFAGSTVMSPNGSIDAKRCLYYTLASLLTCIVDLGLCAQELAIVKYNVFAHAAPRLVRFARALCVISPVIDSTTAILAAFMCIDAQDTERILLLEHWGDAEAMTAGAYRTEYGSSRSNVSHETVPFQGPSFKLSSGGV